MTLLFVSDGNWLGRTVPEWAKLAGQACGLSFKVAWEAINALSDTEWLCIYTDATGDNATIEEFDWEYPPEQRKQG
jgi:hypothetical protein